MLGSVAAIVGVGVGLLLLLWALQRRLIYFPFPSDVPSAAEVLPRARDVVFETEDGLSLAGWLVEPSTADARAGVVVFGGNAGHRGFRAPLAVALAEHGLTVLLFDYRGFGGNPGKPTAAGLLSDGRAARAFLAAETGFENERLIYFGESLGAAVAVALATEHPPAALILRSPFASLAAIARYHYPFLPIRLLLRDRYPSTDRIGRVAAPLLVIVGEDDRIVPVESSRDLYDAANQPKRFVTVAGADHNDLALLAGERMMTEIGAFLDAHLGPPRTR